jgi:hypothetical protein
MVLKLLLHKLRSGMLFFNDTWIIAKLKIFAVVESSRTTLNLVKLATARNGELDFLLSRAILFVKWHRTRQ